MINDEEKTFIECLQEETVIIENYAECNGYHEVESGGGDVYMQFNESNDNYEEWRGNAGSSTKQVRYDGWGDPIEEDEEKTDENKPKGDGKITIQVRVLYF